jgi:DNA-directed RNA polymerase specialized sigma24 family protein
MDRFSRELALVEPDILGEPVAETAANSLGPETEVIGTEARPSTELRLTPHVMAQLKQFVSRRVGNADDAADIVQQTALLACTELRAGGIDNLPRWLCTVARHLIVDQYRSLKRFHYSRLGTTLAETEPNLRTRPDLALVVAEYHERLSVLLKRIACLGCLEYQVAVLLSDVYGYSDKRSAAELRMSVPCFKLMLHGARARLREISETAKPGDYAMLPMHGRLGVTCGAGASELFTLRCRLFEGLRR